MRLHVRINGITHEATAYESHSLLSLSCETRPHPRMQVKYHNPTVGTDVGLAAPIDCMACLVRLVLL